MAQATAAYLTSRKRVFNLVRCRSKQTPKPHKLKISQEATAMDNKEFVEKLKPAKERVKAWPEWKKNILKESSKSRNDVPRRPVAASSDLEIKL